jgi:LysR family transcriptional regulator of gallate degradation
MAGSMPRSKQRLPSLQQLRAFEAVADRESISAAAKTIHLSQPSVTQAIGDLECKVGAALFDRRRNGCYLTSAGTIFRPRVLRTLTQLRGALCEPIVGQPFVERAGAASLERKLTDAQMRGLIAISESVSFDEAARRLAIAEPSLHRSARSLERTLRRTLYRRTAQGFTTTPPGTELARRFKLAAREIEYGIDEIGAAQGRFVSRIAVGNIPHSNTHLLSATINELLAKFPNASVEVLDGHYNDLLAALRGGSLDVVYGVLRRPKWAFDVEERLLFSNPYAIVARRDHPLRLRRRRRVTISDLARYDWVMPPQGTPRRHAFELIFKDRKSKPKVSIETTSLGIYRSVLATSDRLSLFSHREVDEDRIAGIEALPYDSSRLQRKDGIAIRKDWRPTRIHLEFLERLAVLAAIRGGKKSA